MKKMLDILTTGGRLELHLSEPIGGYGGFDVRTVPIIDPLHTYTVCHKTYIFSKLYTKLYIY